MHGSTYSLYYPRGVVIQKKRIERGIKHDNGPLERIVCGRSLEYDVSIDFSFKPIKSCMQISHTVKHKVNSYEKQRKDIPQCIFVK